MDMGGRNNGTGMIMSPPPSSPSTPSMNMDNGTTTMNGMSMMHMTFFWGHKVNILFSGWPGDRHGVGMYVLALFLVFAMSVLVEFVSYAPRLSRRGPTAAGLVLTGLAAVRTGLSYLVMLAVMSFNIGVLIVAILGHAVGFFVFGSGVFLRRRQTNESDQQTLPNKS